MIFKNINAVFPCFYFYFFYLFLDIFFEFLPYAVCIIKCDISVFQLSEQF